MTDAVAVIPGEAHEREAKRQLAILRAVGLDRVPAEQKELALAIAKRYELDLMLKHLVLIDGRPYITRDALLHIAHRSGRFDGIQVTEPVVKNIEGIGDYWYAEATVWRSDMSHPFTYGGRYPTKGGNQKFAPEMATKVAECMALRRAFDVSAPTAEERWDAEVPTAEPEPPKSLAEKVAEKAAAVTVLAEPMPVEVSDDLGPILDDYEAGEQADIPADLPIPEPAPSPKAEAATTTAKQTTPGTEPSATTSATGEGRCPSISKLSGEQCGQYAGHASPLHRTKNEAWTAADAA